PAAALVLKPFPTEAAASAGEQPQLAVVHPPAAKVVQHLLQVGAGHPLRFCHANSSDAAGRPYIRVRGRTSQPAGPPQGKLNPATGVMAARSGSATGSRSDPWRTLLHFGHPNVGVS